MSSTISRSQPSPAAEGPQDTIDRTPRAEELPGGIVHAEFLGELSDSGGRRWENATSDERDRLATDAAVTARVTLEWARSHGYDSMAAYIAATSDPPELVAASPKRLIALPTHEDPVRSGSRPLAEVSGDPPPPLIVDRLDPEGHTILYGTGGVGKGTLASWWIVQLVRAGHRVLILDYENHPTEWRRRIDGLGGPNAVAGVHWAGPLTASWPGARGPLWTQAEDVRAEIAATKATFLVIDSIVFACAGGDPMLPGIAALYTGALEYLGIPTLSLGHVTKADDLRYPFGTVLWHNGARTTWSLKRDGERAILDHRKHNNYSSKGRFVVETTWHDDLPREVWERGYTVVLADRVAEVLEDSEGMTPAEIVDALNDADAGEPVKQDSVRKVLQRGTKGTDRKYTVTEGRWRLVA